MLQLYNTAQAISDVFYSQQLYVGYRIYKLFMGYVQFYITE